MGHEIEAVLLARGHGIVARIDEKPGLGDATTPSKEHLREADVAIEFSLSEGVKKNAAIYAEAGLAAVVGTTGWKKDEAEVRGLVEKAGSGYVRGSNFSIGAHIFFALAEEAARLINPFPNYDVMLHEIHHNQKKDSPSGTALTAGERILKGLDRKTKIVTERLDRQILPEEIHIASVRGGTVPGTHTLVLDSLADSIEVTHTARSRNGFALGAVLAAEWIIGKKGFYTVEDFITEIFKNRR
jgi:4-hydroxy-tetrahydrodipicolinate reductase